MASSKPFAESRKARVAKSLKLRENGMPRIMAIINCTPDSFHPSSRMATSESATEYALNAISEGADWIDIGGESTRPGASDVSIEEELMRVIPAISQIRKLRPDALISIDTRNVEVAKQAIEAGADMINDVSGLRDKSMEDLVISSGCGVCIMHMLGEPRDMQKNPDYENVVDEVSTSLLIVADRLVERGHSPELICLDPGIGFGKKLEHNLDLLRNSNDLRGSYNYSITWGVSRKSMFADLLGRKETGERLSGTLGVAAFACELGIDVLRVHDVGEHRDFINTISALKETKL